MRWHRIPLISLSSISSTSWNSLIKEFIINNFKPLLFRNLLEPWPSHWDSSQETSNQIGFSIVNSNFIITPILSTLHVWRFMHRQPANHHSTLLLEGEREQGMTSWLWIVVSTCCCCCCSVLPVVAPCRLLLLVVARCCSLEYCADAGDSAHCMWLHLRSCVHP